MASPFGSGTMLGERYRIDAVIGSGGMAVVYRAQDTSLGRPVAVKVFHPEDAGSAAIARRRVEVDLLARLNHPALVTLFDAGLQTSGDGDVEFLVMEFVAGSDLRDHLARGRLPPADVAAIGTDLAEALAYIHGHGVIHRDLKPGNVLLPEAGTAGRTRAKLADFGIARILEASSLTMTGTVVGTASYLSPEQALGQPLSGAADVYALGLVLLESLTGERAFPGTAAESMTARIASDPRIPGRLGADWGDLLRRMTARDPAARPDAAAAARELEAARGFALVPDDQDGDDTAAMQAGAPSDGAQTRILDPTLVIPHAETLVIPHTEATQLLRQQPAAPADASTRRRPGEVKRRMLVVAVSAAAALAIAAAIAVPALTTAPSAIQPSYPAVPGVLGEHLTQLQQAVAP